MAAAASSPPCEPWLQVPSGIGTGTEGTTKETGQRPESAVAGQSTVSLHRGYKVSTSQAATSTLNPKE